MTELQIKLQEAILLKIHNGCSIEEAKYKEMELGCKTNYYINSDKDIHGLPPTLPRVLYAIGVDYDYSGELGCITHKVDGWEDEQRLCERRLLNKNGTETTLFDQSDETQKEIGELLGVTL